MTGFPEWSATAYCLFMKTIVSTRTMTSLRLRAKFKPYVFKLKSLQFNRIKFSRKSYPCVGNAFVLKYPLYNLKILLLFFKKFDVHAIWTKVVFHTENTVESLIFNVKSLHLIFIYFT